LDRRLGAPATFTPKVSAPWHLLDRRLDDSQSQSGCSDGRSMCRLDDYFKPDLEVIGWDIVDWIQL